MTVKKVLKMILRNLRKEDKIKFSVALEKVNDRYERALRRLSK